MRAVGEAQLLHAVVAGVAYVERRAIARHAVRPVKLPGLLATAIVGIALLAHAAARPFEAPLTDVTELFSLVANLVLLVSVPVYSVLQADNTAPGRVGGVTRFLEWLALLLIVAVCAVSMCKCSNALALRLC